MTEPDGVDRQSPVPYYQQVSDVLEQRIGSGVIARGERLPSEKELGDEFGLARATIRQALQLLESRGLVQRVPNRGVFAGLQNADRGWVIQNTEGFLENAVGRQNRSVTTQVLRAGEIELPEFATSLLDIPTGERGYELVRLRSLDGIPALYSINYSPPVIAPIVAASPEVLSGSGSLSELLSNAGHPLRGAQRTIRALTAGPEISRILGISDATPVLRVRSTSWSDDGKPFDVYETWVRSDVVPLEVNVSSIDLGPTR
jgi:GntR family transcriptional regulator